MKAKLIFILTFIIFNISVAQQSITINECYEKAYKESPIIKKKEYNNRVNNLKQKIINTNWYPSIELNGQVSYQSDVVQMDLDMSPLINYINGLIPAGMGSPNTNAPSFEIPEAPKDQYKITLDLKQTIYNGGITKKNKKLEEQLLNINNQQVEVDLFSIKNQVSQVYFSITLLDKNIELLQILKQNIDTNISIMESGVENGTILQSNLDVLLAEKLKLNQQYKELKILKNATINILELLINDTLLNNCELVMPDIVLFDTIKNKRPELDLFTYNVEMLNAKKTLMKAQLQPKVYAFSQFGYGNPGLNMLNNEFDTYYIIGAGFKWTLFDWNKNKNERQIIDIQKNIVHISEKNFNRNISVAAQQKISEIKKLEELIITDKEIIELRRRITKNAESQLKNGIINSSQYLIEFNSEKQALINNKIHKIQLVQAKVDYLNLFGNY